MLKSLLFVIPFALAVGSQAMSAPLVWGGPAIEFSKAGFADPTLAENQDRLTNSIWITRFNTRGLFNAASEGSQGPTSPAGTLWAVGTTADLPSLEFKTWLELIEPGSAINGPPNSVGLDFVVQLVDEQIYLDLRFTSWGEGSSSGGGFSYVRSTAAIPEPATGSIALVALLAISARRGRPTRQL